MKKSCLIFAFGFALLFSCNYLSSPQKRMDGMIKDHIKANIDNWETYLPMESSQLGEAYTSAKETAEYKKFDYSKTPIHSEISLREAQLNHKRHVENGNIPSDGYVLNKQQELVVVKELQVYRDTLRQIESRIRKFEEQFVPQYIGLKTHHIFQTKNKEGSPVVNYFVYYFDDNIFNLIGVKQIYRNLPLKTYGYGNKVHRINLEN